MWHTFSDESESYHAPQGTTPNLMDYSGGTDLNHLQWQWMHESHTNLLGFLDDESEGESVLDQSVIQKYLTQIHSANVKNEKEMIIAKPSGFAQQLDLTLDGNKLSFIGFGEKPEGFAISLTSSLYETVSIKPNEIAEINYIENSIEYTKLSFHQAEHKTPMKEMVLTENTVFEIIVKASEAEVLKDYLFANMEYLMAKDQLTAQQIAIVRDGISKVEDETKRGELYLELQKKVPYHNQRDNNPSYKNKSVSKEVKTEKDRKYEADRMCNLTSVAMAFEMLGISKEDVYNKLVEDGFDVTSEKDKDFEDILDIVRVKKNFTLDRTKSELWEQIANYLGVEMTVTMVNSSKKNTNTINAINKALSEGKGVILSMYNNKGHIVRIQAISNDNIVVDDPYGNVSSMAYRELKPDHGESYQGSTNGTNIQNSSYYNGSNCTLTWDEIDVSKSSGRGGTYEVRGNQIYKSDKYDENRKKLPEDQIIDHYVKDWINDRSIPGRNEYLTRTEIGNKTDRENNVVVDKNGKPITENITYYTAHGGMLKYYVVFSKKENKKQ